LKAICFLARQRQPLEESSLYTTILSTTTTTATTTTATTTATTTTTTAAAAAAAAAAATTTTIANKIMSGCLKYYSYHCHVGGRARHVFYKIREPEDYGAYLVTIMLYILVSFRNKCREVFGLTSPAASEVGMLCQ
jgi:hypothetical protein